MGRWLSPDWSAKAEPVPYAKLDDPQSLNLYAYVRNNPMIRFDPDGHAGKDWCAGSGAGSLACGVQTAWNNAHGIVNNALNKAGSYFYAKGGNGTGLGVNDVKVGPVKVDIIQRKGQDVTRTTDGKKVENVNEVGVKVGLGGIKVGLSRTTTQEEGQAPKTEWVPGFSIGKFEGENAQVGLGFGGCVFVCGLGEVGVRADKVLQDVSDFVKSAPADPNDPIPYIGLR
jgi:hypothetical protein